MRQIPSARWWRGAGPSGARFLSLIILLSGTFSIAANAAFTSENIAEKIEKFALEQLIASSSGAGFVEPVYTVRLVPDRRPLAACGSEPVLAVVALRPLNRLRVAMTCAAVPGWRREFLVRATLTAQVVVTVQPLGAGQVAGAGQLALARRDITAIADPLPDVAAAQGQSSRLALPAGAVLRASQLQGVALVRRGQSVTIAAQREQVEVSMAGEALDNGTRGAVVRVRNASSGSVIRARVRDTGVVDPVDGGME